MRNPNAHAEGSIFEHTVRSKARKGSAMPVRSWFSSVLRWRR